MSDTQRILLDTPAAGFIPGPDLAGRLGVSRAVVWKHVEVLRDEGLGAESAGDGYVVTDVSEYGAPAIEYGLDADYGAEFHEILDSSNDRTRDLVAEGASDVVVVAREQTASRDRKNREWSALDGGVWLSLLVRPNEPPVCAPLYTLAMTIATCDAACEAGVDAEVKRSNDAIMSKVSGDSPVHADDRSTDADAPDDCGYRKLYGIPIETKGEADRVSWFVIDPGVNVNFDPTGFPEVATSVVTEADPIERRVFVQRVLEHFDALRSDPDAVLPARCERADTFDRWVRIHTANDVIEGSTVDIEHPGMLVVSANAGEKRVHVGDYEHLRPADDGR